MRLFLSAERLRAVRIALLKATHFPHVGLIMLYEYLCRSINSRGFRGLPLSASKSITPERPRRSKRYSRNARLAMPQPLMVSTLKRDSLGRQSHDQGEAPSAPTSLMDLRALLSQLTSQVDVLNQKIDGMEQTHDQSRPT